MPVEAGDNRHCSRSLCRRDAVPAELELLVIKRFLAPSIRCSPRALLWTSMIQQVRARQLQDSSEAGSLGVLLSHDAAHQESCSRTSPLRSSRHCSYNRCTSFKLRHGCTK